MEKILATLERQGFLKNWSDAQIIPGQSISSTIHTKLTESDIVVFLFSPDFLASEECLKEWHSAKQLASSGRLLFRVPIIVRYCAWRDFLGDDDVKALPCDGKPITTDPDSDSAWQEVYEGIKSVVESLRATFTAKPSFLKDLYGADLPSSNPIALDDIFVFPRLIEHDYTATADRLRDAVISSVGHLRDRGTSIIHGQEKAGKTALAKQLVASLIRDRQPVLFVDLDMITKRIQGSFLPRLYEEQFTGDYHLWQQQANKTLVIDNMTEAPAKLDFVAACSETFSHTYLFVSSDVFYSFLMDEVRLAQFRQIRIDPLTSVQQEKLIRKRLATLEREGDLTDGFIDQVEDRVDSIIISNKIVPRYPFFVLSILQTFDALMPISLSITSYGHCYYIFILASLSRAGISELDDAINSSVNFAEQLALATFLRRKEGDNKPFDFSAFQEQYKSDYFISKPVFSRLTHNGYGIISANGDFKSTYMYYFFLGKVLAANADLAAAHIPELCTNSYADRNYLTLLFAIHHATDNAIIEEIMLGTMVELDHVPIATLSQEETTRFSSIVAELPHSVLSSDSVEEERAKERRAKDRLKDELGEGGEEQDNKEADELWVGMLRVLKNNRILGQVLRNQHGKLPKSRIEEIVETIADGAFRLVNMVLKDEEEIRTLALHIRAQSPEVELDKVQQGVRRMSFWWTIANIEAAVNAVSVPSIREAVEEVLKRNTSPAYEIFGYFCQLDSGNALTSKERDKLADLYKRHRDNFVKLVLSIRTQWYMNTHRSQTSVEQSICSVLGIQYTPRLRRLG